MVGVEKEKRRSESTLESIVGLWRRRVNSMEVYLVMFSFNSLSDNKENLNYNLHRMKLLLLLSTMRTLSGELNKREIKRIEEEISLLCNGIRLTAV